MPDLRRANAGLSFMRMYSVTIEYRNRKSSRSCLSDCPEYVTARVKDDRKRAGEVGKRID